MVRPGDRIPMPGEVHPDLAAAGYDAARFERISGGSGRPVRVPRRVVPLHELVDLSWPDDSAWWVDAYVHVHDDAGEADGRRSSDYARQLGDTMFVADDFTRYTACGSLDPRFGWWVWTVWVDQDDVLYAASKARWRPTERRQLEVLAGIHGEWNPPRGRHARR